MKVLKYRSDIKTYIQEKDYKHKSDLMWPSNSDQNSTSEKLHSYNVIIHSNFW